MRLPGFEAQASLYKSGSSYLSAKADTNASGQVIPAIPPCRNCDYICDVCERRGVACGACALCDVGWCDPSPPGWGGPTEL